MISSWQLDKKDPDQDKSTNEIPGTTTTTTTTQQQQKPWKMKGREETEKKDKVPTKGKRDAKTVTAPTKVKK